MTRHSPGYSNSLDKRNNINTRFPNNAHVYRKCSADCVVRRNGRACTGKQVSKIDVMTNLSCAYWKELVANLLAERI